MQLLMQLIALDDGVFLSTATETERAYYRNLAEIRLLPPNERIIAAAEAYVDQLNAFNNIAHPEVRRRRVELAAAVGARYRR